MEEVNVNKFNWGTLLHFYLDKYHAELLENADPIFEKSSYSLNYSLGIEKEESAKKVAKAIMDIVENVGIILEIIRYEGNEIKWDEN